MTQAFGHYPQERLVLAIERDNLLTDQETVALIQERLHAVRTYVHDYRTCPVCNRAAALAKGRTR